MLGCSLRKKSPLQTARQGLPTHSALRGILVPQALILPSLLRRIFRRVIPWCQPSPDCLFFFLLFFPLFFSSEG